MGACTSCSSGACSTAVGGCKNNGGCKTGGCNKMNVFDWISRMELPVDGIRFRFVEVRFKNGRKDFYHNTNNLDLVIGDAIVVETQGGHHIGHVSMMGELVRLQMQKKKVDPESSDLKTIYRMATAKDLEKYEQARSREMTSMYRSRELILQHNLQMKLSDVEFQADNTKAIFYYSAEERVDFRELIKTMASEFKVRIEMKQISLRQEAGRLGGLGVCGRELCCSTWLADFKNVATSAARYQNLSLNPAKLSGQCGRLKCCLNYELDTYMEALKDIPEVEGSIRTQRGEARLQKTDIFRKLMWFAYRDDESNWIPVSTERVKQLIEFSAKGKTVDFLTEEEATQASKPQNTATATVTGELTRLDSKLDLHQKKKKRKKKKRKGGQNPSTASTNPPSDT
jgi:cell fate regulator YaaT (PSP1 superfamily)